MLGRLLLLTPMFALGLLAGRAEAQAAQLVSVSGILSGSRNV